MTAMNEEAMRAAFEAWAKSKGYRMDRDARDPTAYDWSNTCEAWDAWQAALAAQSAEVERLQGCQIALAKEAATAWKERDELRAQVEAMRGAADAVLALQKGGAEACETCKGTGDMHVKCSDGFEHWMKTIDCDQCGGTGKAQQKGGV